jgi:hypothetical protein
MKWDENSRPEELFGRPFAKYAIRAIHHAVRRRGSTDGVALELFVADVLQSRLEAYREMDKEFTLRDFIGDCPVWHVVREDVAASRAPEGGAVGSAGAASGPYDVLAMMTSKKQIAAFLGHTFYDVFPVSVPEMFKCSATLRTKFTPLSSSLNAYSQLRRGPLWT